ALMDVMAVFAKKLVRPARLTATTPTMNLIVRWSISWRFGAGNIVSILRGPPDIVVGGFPGPSAGRGTAAGGATSPARVGATIDLHFAQPLAPDEALDLDEGARGLDAREHLAVRARRLFPA